MNKSTFIRISGWAMILSGIGFLTLFTSWYLEENYPLLHLSDTYGYYTYISGLMVGPVLLAIGMLGLRVRYGEMIGTEGKLTLLFGSIFGFALTSVGVMGQLLEIIIKDTDTSFTVLLTGPVVMMAFLVVFGILALRHKPFPRWNGLPILAGIVFPVMVFFSMVLGLLNDFPWYGFAGLAIQFLAMIALGFILQGDASQQEASIAAA